MDNSGPDPCGAGRPGQVINGFVDTIVVVARMVSDQLGTPADEIVRVCSARADGSLPDPD